MGGVLAVVGAGAVLVAASLLVGTAVRLLLRPGAPPSLGTTAGLGAAAGSVVVALAYRATATTRPALAVLLAASLVVVAVAVVRRWRAHGARPLARSVLASLGGRTELVAVGLVVVVMLPLLLLGPTWWSLGSDDLHRYVGSAQFWTSGEAGARDFAAVQTGPYLAGHEQRALSEKPMATALLVTASAATGLEPYRVPGAVMLLLLLVTASSLLLVLVRQWRVPLVLAGCAVAATTLSVVPMVRVLEAQPGQVAAVAWLALALAVVAGSERRPLGSALAAAVALAAATGANPSVVAGSAPLWAATAVWAMHRARAAPGTAVRVLLGAAGGALVLVAAFVPWFLESWRLQGGGAEGHDVPFVSPLALIGLQPGTDPRVPAWTTWAAWAVLAGALVVLAVRGRDRAGGRWPRPGLAVAVVALLSALALVAVYGPDNYVVHKWAAVLIALVMPLALAVGFQRLAAREAATPAIRRAVPVAVAAGALAISVASAAAVPHVGSDDLLALADDARLASLPVLNVDVDDLLERSMLPLVVPAGSVVVVRPTYDDAAPPADAPSLVRTEQLATGAWTDVVRLDGTYSLARRDLAAGVERATAADPRSLRLLHGDWYVVGEDLRTTSSVAWLVAEPLEPGGMRLRLEGLTAPRATTLQVRAGGRVLAEVALAPGRRSDAEVVVPASLLRDGRLQVALATPPPPRRSDIGQAGFAVRAVLLAPL